MKTRNSILIGLLLAITTSNSQAKYESLGSLEWLNHRWVSKTDSNISVESWVRVSDESFEGIGETIDINSGKENFSASVRILQMNGQVFYLAKVKQNPLPVAFKSIECSQRVAIFENTEHDFPQRLEYRHESDNVLKVIVSGQEGRAFDVVYSKHDD
ncbi:MAG: hypothetical protein ACI8PV_000792 [Dinoroseobacter sp.]|jgi:hypothetical protein